MKCETCKWFEAHRDALYPARLNGTCKRVITSGQVMQWDDRLEEYLIKPEYIDTTAFINGYDIGGAYLCVAAHFGCVMWEPPDAIR